MRIGVSINGITDVNGDGIPDIVVTENVSGNPVVRVINARTGAVTVEQVVLVEEEIGSASIAATFSTCRANVTPSQ